MIKSGIDGASKVLERNDMGYGDIKRLLPKNNNAEIASHIPIGFIRLHCIFCTLYLSNSIGKNSTI